MADASAATPGSSTTSKTPATKDKECQYCHQAFTSSSLGRHLDLYIKDKNTKPPDDVHNVEEIRRLRGNVTRRQARTSSGKREGSTPSSSKPTPFRDQRSPSIQGSYSNNQPQHPDGGPIRTYLNKPNWQSTGVINDLPPVADHALYSRRLSPSRRPSVKEEIIHKQNMLEERDRARAAELALKEVLESVKAANSRAHPSSPFDFNFFGFSFPELCLQCLSAPHSLSSGVAIPDPNSWSTEAPKFAHYEVLRDWLDSKLKDWQGQRQPHSSQNHYHQPNGINGNSRERLGSNTFRKEAEQYRHHISSVYDQWKVLSDKKKQDTWLLECAKAFTREQERHKETKHQLDLAEQKIQLLRSQLSQSQHPPEFSAYILSTLPISRESADYLPPSDFFDYEALLAKWKGRVQSTRSMQQPLPPPSPWATATPPNLNSNTTNGSAYPPTYHGDQKNHHNNNDAEPPSDEDEDLADALGDEEDLDQHRGMNKNVLDPTLRDGDTDGEGQAGGRMLMGLREYGGSGGDNGVTDMERR